MNSKIELTPGEQVVRSLHKETLTLTTKRVRYDSAAFGGSNFISITLDCVASCGLVTKSYPILLFIAAAAFIAALTQDSDTKIILFVVAIGSVIGYFLTRRAVMSIASNGGETILLAPKDLNRGPIIEFYEAVEREKLKMGNRHRPPSLQAEVPPPIKPHLLAEG